MGVIGLIDWNIQINPLDSIIIDKWIFENFSLDEFLKDFNKFNERFI